MPIHCLVTIIFFSFGIVKHNNTSFDQHRSPTHEHPQRNKEKSRETPQKRETYARNLVSPPPLTYIHVTVFKTPRNTSKNILRTSHQIRRLDLEKRGPRCVNQCSAGSKERLLREKASFESVTEGLRARAAALESANASIEREMRNGQHDALAR